MVVYRITFVPASFLVYAIVQVLSATAPICPAADSTDASPETKERAAQLLPSPGDRPATLPRQAEVDARILEILKAEPEIEVMPRDVPRPEVLQYISSDQPESGNALVNVVVDRSNPLSRKAGRLFKVCWNMMSAPQIEWYFYSALRLETKLRPQYPQGVKAWIPSNYAFSYDAHESYVGWPSNLKPKVQTTTVRFLDGKPYGDVFRFSYPQAASGSYQVGELELGGHTIHWTTEYVIQCDGRTYRGKVRSPSYTFEVVPADTPDHLAAPANPELDRLVRSSISFYNPVEEAFPGEFDQFPDRRPRLAGPAVLMNKPDGSGSWAVMTPSWEVSRKLPVDLCFVVEFHVQETGETFQGSTIYLPKGQTQSWHLNTYESGWVNKAGVGTHFVDVTLKPSRTTALSYPEVTQYFNGEIRAENLYIKINDGPPLNRPR